MDQNPCPKCGVQIPDHAPAGQCPRCMMKAGLESLDGGRDAGQSMDPTAFRSNFVAPSPEELGRHFPQFEIVELLGRGGMGAVYKARQPNLDRYVALKILPPEVGQDPAFADRFMREARALAMLNHSCIVAVYDFGEADGLYYFVMEYVDGTNLRQTIETGGLKPPEALAIVPQICDALQFAHDEGVVHRDIKPDNILIDKRGRVKIADFGLAKLLAVDSENSPAKRPFTLTGTNQVMGTPHYMAPEQMQGSSAVDHRADIYSLGVVFYEMLTGELPIGRFEPPSNKVQIDVRLDEVVLRSLESTPERRFQHASNVKTEIESILGGNNSHFASSAHEKPVTIGTSFQLELRRRLKVPAIGLLVAGIVNLVATLAVVLIPVFAGVWGIDAEGLKEVSFLSLVIALFSLVSGIVLLLGASRMFDLQSWPVTVVAAVVAIVPCAVGFVISFPFGIWALIVLLRRDVRIAFADWEAREPAATHDTESGSAIGGMMVIGLSIGVAIGVALDDIPLYLSFGLVFGILIGAVIDAQKRRKSKER